MVWLLNDVYDVEHRANFMSEKKMELTPLKIRSHGASSVMHYDERYTPYIEMTGLLPFVQLALIGMSPQEPEVEDGGKKDRVPAGATFTWIAANFAHCPEDADDEVIQSWTMLVAGRQRTVELVVVCSYFQYGAGNAYLLRNSSPPASSFLFTSKALYNLANRLSENA
ncbi:mutator protein [Hordeum vulgare]|nr:mutator protein [Hordeum vulgare]